MKSSQTVNRSEAARKAAATRASKAAAAKAEQERKDAEASQAVQAKYEAALASAQARCEHINRELAAVAKAAVAVNPEARPTTASRSSVSHSFDRKPFACGAIVEVNFPDPGGDSCSAQLAVTISGSEDRKAHVKLSFSVCDLSEATLRKLFALAQEISGKENARPVVRCFLRSDGTPTRVMIPSGK